MAAEHCVCTIYISNLCKLECPSMCEVNMPSNNDCRWVVSLRFYPGHGTTLLHFWFLKGDTAAECYISNVVCLDDFTRVLDLECDRRTLL